jgi:hypothetical protein
MPIMPRPLVAAVVGVAVVEAAATLAAVVVAAAAAAIRAALDGAGATVAAAAIPVVAAAVTTVAAAAVTTAAAAAATTAVDLVTPADLAAPAIPAALATAATAATAIPRRPRPPNAANRLRLPAVTKDPAAPLPLTAMIGRSDLSRSNYSGCDERNHSTFPPRLPGSAVRPAGQLFLSIRALHQVFKLVLPRPQLLAADIDPATKARIVPQRSCRGAPCLRNRRP